MDLRAHHHKVRIDSSRAGKPTDNSLIETFAGSLRDEGLNVHCFTSLDEAKAIFEAWRTDHDECRPHVARNGVPPGEFARRHDDRKQSTNGRNVDGSRSTWRDEGEQFGCPGRYARGEAVTRDPQHEGKV